MDISLEDFNALSAERSSRDVKIARLEMQLASEQTNHERELNNLMTEVEFLRNEAAELRKKLDLMMADFENLRFENHWMKQYILISVDRVRYFFQHIRNIEVLSAIKSFVLDVLPEDTTAEAYAFVSKTMELPKDENVSVKAPTNHFIHLSGDGATYNENSQE